MGNATNKNTNNNSGNRSISLEFCHNLTLAFIVLRLCDVIDWPWYVVMMPLWIPLALMIVFFVIGILIGETDNG